MLNRHRLRAIAEENGVPVTKTLKTWPRGGELVALVVDRPADELAEELRELGLIP